MALLAARRWYLSVMAQHRRPRGELAGAQVCQRRLAKRQRQSVVARLTARTTRRTILSVPYRGTPGSWEPWNARLAQLHGFTVCRYGNRIGAHNPEVTGSPPFVGTGESWPRYLRGVPKGASFALWLVVKHTLDGTPRYARGLALHSRTLCTVTQRDALRPGSGQALSLRSSECTVLQSEVSDVQPTVALGLRFWRGEAIQARNR